MEKIDYKKVMKDLYGPSPKSIVWVDVPELNYLMIDGIGDPNTSIDYRESIETLFSLAYTIKFMIKKGKMAVDYGVMPLEGLWWVNDMSKFDPDDKSEWKWTSMIMQPDLVTPDLVEEAIELVKKKKNPPTLPKVRFESFKEGKAAQTLHIGPFSEEGPTILRIHDFIIENGYELGGKHHEIYLSDIRKADPLKWKTVIRQPVKQ